MPGSEQEKLATRQSHSSQRDCQMSWTPHHQSCVKDFLLNSPISSQGGLGLASARYLLHQYFLRHHSWSRGCPIMVNLSSWHLSSQSCYYDQCVVGCGKGITRLLGLVLLEGVGVWGAGRRGLNGSKLVQCLNPRAWCEYTFPELMQLHSQPFGGVGAWTILCVPICPLFLGSNLSGHLYMPGCFKAGIVKLARRHGDPNRCRPNASRAAQGLGAKRRTVWRHCLESDGWSANRVPRLWAQFYPSCVPLEDFGTGV